MHPRCRERNASLLLFAPSRQALPVFPFPAPIFGLCHRSARLLFSETSHTVPQSAPDNVCFPPCTTYPAPYCHRRPICNRYQQTVKFCVRLFHQTIAQNPRIHAERQKPPRLCRIPAGYYINPAAVPAILFFLLLPPWKKLLGILSAILYRIVLFGAFLKIFLSKIRREVCALC